MSAQKIVAGANGHAHEPMFERCFTAKTSKFFKCLEPDGLRDVFDLAVATRVATRGGKNARRKFLNQRLEARGVALEHRRNQFRFGSFHWREFAREIFGAKAKSELRNSVRPVCKSALTNYRL